MKTQWPNQFLHNFWPSFVPWCTTNITNLHFCTWGLKFSPNASCWLSMKIQLSNQFLHNFFPPFDHCAQEKILNLPFLVLDCWNFHQRLHAASTWKHSARSNQLGQGDPLNLRNLKEIFAFFYRLPSAKLLQMIQKISTWTRTWCQMIWI